MTHPQPARIVKVSPCATVTNLRIPHQCLLFGTPVPLTPAPSCLEQLDRAVDRCYRKEPFLTDRQRVEYRFVLYGQLPAPLVAKPAKRKTVDRE